MTPRCPSPSAPAPAATLPAPAPRARTAALDPLRAGWAKLRTLPGTAPLLLAAVVATIAVSAATAAATRCPAGGCAEDPARISLTGIYLGQTIIAILAVLAISAEYGTGMIAVTFAAMPRRATVLAAKAAVLAALTIPAGVLAVGGSLLAGALILPGHGISPAHGYPALTLADPPVLRAAAGSVLYLILIALLALGVATCLRDSAVAIGVVLALLFLFPIIAATVGATLSRHLQQIAPMQAGLAIQATTNLRALPIAPWPGLGVLAAWSLAALLLAAHLLTRRPA